MSDEKKKEEPEKQDNQTGSLGTFGTQPDKTSTEEI